MFVHEMSERIKCFCWGSRPTVRMFSRYMSFVLFRYGKAVEHSGVRDDLGLMQQLGVI